MEGVPLEDQVAQEILNRNLAGMPPPSQIRVSEEAHVTLWHYASFHVCPRDYENIRVHKFMGVPIKIDESLEGRAFVLDD